MIKRGTKGFTLVEILVVVSVFAVIVAAFSSMYVVIFRLLTLNRMKVLALDIVNEQVEIVRNLPYSDVGEILGVPAGKIPQVQTITRNNIPFRVGATIRNVDDPFDGRIGYTPNDTAPADYKMVQFDVSLPGDPDFTPLSLVTYVAPKSLENSSTNGALFVNVFDANGNPVQGANVHVENTVLNPDVIIDDVTNASGRLDLVDVPPSAGNYSVLVTKPGYSSERTYPIGGAGNPNPTKPNATVVAQQASQVSFAIDEVSSMNISTVDATCAPVGGVDFTLRGSKLIGTTPTYKYPVTAHVTDGGGAKSLSNMEWDTYSLSVTDPSFDLLGSNPLFPFSVLPGSVNDIQLVVGPKVPRTLLLGVKDVTTGLPVTDASVTLTKTGYSGAAATGRGFVRQTDWSGGAGQADWSNATKYASSDGNVIGTNPAGELKLRNTFSTYSPSGDLTSSIFDMGATTTFSQILWTPTDQPAQTGASSVRFQIALSDTNTATTTWNFVGPGGTSATYFTTANQNISSSANTGRYVRYKAFLSTSNTAYTPNISDIMITFTSTCVPPGQVVFTGLASGTYNVRVEKTGYTDYVGTVNMSSDYVNSVITLSP